MHFFITLFHNNSAMEKKLHSLSKPWRWAKTLFFLISMLSSLLLLSASPILVVVLDFLLPPALLSAASTSPITVPVLSLQLTSFHFSTSFIDIVLLSIARSVVILCAYIVCEGHERVYPVITTVCSFASFAYVLVKTVSMCVRIIDGGRSGIEALFFTSVALAIAHVVVAYRTCCRQRKKLLLVYRIDIEAVKLKGVPIKGDSIF